MVISLSLHLSHSLKEPTKQSDVAPLRAFGALYSLSLSLITLDCSAGDTTTFCSTWLLCFSFFIASLLTVSPKFLFLCVNDLVLLFVNPSRFHCALSRYIEALFSVEGRFRVLRLPQRSVRAHESNVRGFALVSERATASIHSCILSCFSVCCALPQHSPSAFSFPFPPH